MFENEIKLEKKKKNKRKERRRNREMRGTSIDWVEVDEFVDTVVECESSCNDDALELCITT